MQPWAGILSRENHPGQEVTPISGDGYRNFQRWKLHGDALEPK
jgi:hypothetical protein